MRASLTFGAGVLTGFAIVYAYYLRIRREERPLAVPESWVYDARRKGLI